jgi:hypothetical protein
LPKFQWAEIPVQPSLSTRTSNKCDPACSAFDGLELHGAQFWDQMIVVGVLIALGAALGGWLGRRRSRPKAHPVMAGVEKATTPV